jgi:hypothetical protein
MAQEEAVTAAPFEFLCARENEPAYLNGVPVRFDDTWERRDHSSADLTPARCWAWSDSCPPRLLEPGESAVAACRTGGGSSRQLTVRVRAPEAAKSNADPAVGAAAAAEFEVTAAPVAMWRQVPRDLLPAISVAPGPLSLTRTDETWRLQARSEGFASTWRDVISEEGSVELALQEAVDFTVQVTAGGAPLVGARMYLVRVGSGLAASRPEPLGFGVTDTDGKASLVVSERERAAVLVSHVARSASAFERLADVPPVVELGPGLAVTGRAVDPEGRSVAGVPLLGLSWVADGFGAMQRHLGISGSDGRFLLSGFTRGAASLRTDGGELEYSERFDLEDSLDLGSIVLAATETYRIQVVDASRGTPVSGARTSSEAGEQTTTDRRGMAVVSPRFGRTLLISAKGYRPARFRIGGSGSGAEGRSLPGLPTIPVDVVGGLGATAEEPLVLRLDPAFTVEGVFMAADGVTPAASGRLTAARDMANGQATSHRTIAPDGSFSIDLEPGAYTLDLSAANAGRTVLEVRGSAGEIRDLGVIVAPTSAWVSGTVVNPEFEPVAGASVSYARPSELGQMMARAMGRVATVTTGVDGRFELHGLELGTATLRVEAEEYALLEFQVEAPTVEWVDAGFVELSRGRRITVRSDVGQGVVGLDPGGKGDPLDVVTADLVEGEAVLDLVPEEPFVVRVSRGGVTLCEKDVEESDGDAAIRCDRSAMAVTGRVTTNGQPAAGSLLWSARANSASPTGIVHGLGGPLSSSELMVPTGWQELNADIDDDGRYRLEAVLPGEWKVTWMTPAEGWQESREVTVPDGPGKEYTLSFDYGGVSIEGVVTDADGQPVHVATVDVYPQRKAVVSGPDGRFRILDLAPGAYQVRARFRHQRSALVDVELRDYSDRQTIHLELRDDPPNDELVVRLAGGGSGFCFVEMEGAGQRVSRIDGGVARTRLAPPLTDRVRIACQADGRWILSGWQGLERALDRGVDFDPFESDSSIVLQGDPQAASVQITGPAGWDLGQLRLWFGGATSFSVGDSVSNLPAGEYTLRWGNQVRTVWTERRRAAEVEIEN